MDTTTSELKRWWNRLTGRQQTQVLRKQDRRSDRAAGRKAAAA
jgi:hypothetical protein